MIRVLIDGVMYGLQEFGGISRCFTENLSRLGLYSDEIQIVLHIPGHCQARTPKAKWIYEIKDWDLRPRRIFSSIGRRVGKLRSRMWRPQVFHSSYYTLPYWSGLKTVVTVHDFIHEKFPTLSSNSRCIIEQKRRVIESADVIVAVSHSTKDDILTFTNAEESKIVVICHGINDAFIAYSITEADIQTFRKTYKIGNPYWLYVGNRAAYKNFGTLLRAFVRVSLKIGGYLVVIGGEPRLESWQMDLLIKNRLENKVRLLHSIDDVDLQVAYAGAMAFVFPSLAEGFGIPIIEAMACRTPIVASGIPVFREVAGDAACYFDPNDEEALAETMLRLMDEPLRQSIVRKGQNRVSEFSWDKAAKKLGDIYKSLV